MTINEIRDTCYSWKVAAKILGVSADNKSIRNVIDKIMPSYEIGKASYYPMKQIDEVAGNMEKFHIKSYNKAKGKHHYYLEGSYEDDVLNNYITLESFNKMYKDTYGSNISANSYLISRNYAKKFTLFDLDVYMVPKSKLQTILEEYHSYIQINNENNPYRRYELYVEYQDKNQIATYGIKETLKMFDKYTTKLLSTTINQMHLVYVLKNVRQYIIDNVQKEIYKYTNEEIISLVDKLEYDMNTKQRPKFCSFINYVNKMVEECAYDVSIVRKRAKNHKTLDDFYTKDEWMGYIKHIFDINLHIDEAFRNITYARYWLYCMLQCSLSWRISDILDIDVYKYDDFDKYTLDWFENNEFNETNAMEIVETFSRFAEQKLVKKTGAEKHFIILNQFIIGTAIGLVIVNQHAKNKHYKGLFEKFDVDYEELCDTLGEQMKGFKNLKATRTMLSIINEVAADEYPDESMKITSYARSHKSQNTTTIYLENGFSEQNLPSVPKEFNNMGVTGWLYKCIWEVACDNTKIPHYELPRIVNQLSDNIPVRKIEEFSNFCLSENSKRKKVISEIMQMKEATLENLLQQLNYGTNPSKKDNIYCINKKCKYPTCDCCEFCEYSIPSIHALTIIGQEALELMDKIIAREGTPCDQNRYNYQLIKLISIIFDAKSQYGVEYVNIFIDYNEFKNKLLAIRQEGE